MRDASQVTLPTISVKSGVPITLIDVNEKIGQWKLKKYFAINSVKRIIQNEIEAKNPMVNKNVAKLLQI